MPLNMDSIVAKAKSAISSGDCKRRYDETVKNIATGKVELDSRATVHTPEEAADKFIEVLKETIGGSGLGANAAAAISELAHTSAVSLGDGTYSIGVYFSGDLSRPSLDESRYGGISDLAELLDQGVDHTMERVYGTWHGEKHGSRTTILGAHFIDAAAAKFWASYAAEYNVRSLTIDRNY